MMNRILLTLCFTWIPLCGAFAGNPLTEDPSSSFVSNTVMAKAGGLLFIIAAIGDLAEWWRFFDSFFKSVSVFIIGLVLIFIAPYL